MRRSTRRRQHDLHEPSLIRPGELLVGHEAMITAAGYTANLLDEIIRGLTAA